MSLLELFCAVDDFCKGFAPKWQQALISDGLRRRQRETQLSLSERMTIIIHFHQSGYRTFKEYYVPHVCVHLRREFPALVSYTRFVELMPQTLAQRTVLSAIGVTWPVLHGRAPACIEALSSPQLNHWQVVRT